MDDSFVRRGGVDAAAGARSAWLPDRWALGLTGMVSLSSGLDAALWSVLPAAQNVGFGVGAPGAVVLVRAASVLAGANRALRTLLTNVAACAACAAYVMANLRTAELVTDTTFSNLNAFLFHGAIAAVLLGFDGDELKGLRPEPPERARTIPGTACAAVPLLAGGGGCVPARDRDLLRRGLRRTDRLGDPGCRGSAVLRP